MTEIATGKLITDGVLDQHGRKWLCFGTGEAASWIATSELHTLSGMTLARLERAGTSVITTAAKERLKLEAQQFQSFRRASLVDAPGWTGDTYVLPDGAYHTLRGGLDDIIVAFDPDERFAARSNLGAYLGAMEPIVQDQPLLLFALAYGYVGPLLRFAPPDMQNPIVELVGKPEAGKSSLAQAVSSIWGGDPLSSIGTCESWNFSSGKLDELRAKYHHGLLVLDEANKAGDTEHSRAKVIGDAIFKLSDTASRRRFGDGKAPPPVRQAVLSTSNTELRALVGAATDVQQAIVSRVLTLCCDRGHGIFDAVPASCSSARQAVEALLSASVAHAGTAGHAFVNKLCRFSDTDIRRAVDQGLAKQKTTQLARLAPDARTSKTIALTYVAGRIACQLGVLPRPSIGIDATFERLFRDKPIKSMQERSALEIISAYVADHRSALIGIDDARLPLPRSVFDDVPGVWIEAEKRLVVSTHHTMIGIENVQSMLRDLRQLGRLDADTGVLSKKTSRRICQTGRAYHIYIHD